MGTTAVQTEGVKRLKRRDLQAAAEAGQVVRDGLAAGQVVQDGLVELAVRERGRCSQRP